MVLSPQWTEDEGPGTDRAPRTKHKGLVAAFLAFAAIPLTSAAQTPSTWFGSWTLNVERSTYDPGPPPYKRATYTIEPWDADGMKVVIGSGRNIGRVPGLLLRPIGIIACRWKEC